jgi:hypothetical protein
MKGLCIQNKVMNNILWEADVNEAEADEILSIKNSKLKFETD